MPEHDGAASAADHDLDVHPYGSIIYPKPMTTGQDLQFKSEDLQTEDSQTEDLSPAVYRGLSSSSAALPLSSPSAACTGPPIPL